MDDTLDQRDFAVLEHRSGEAVHWDLMIESTDMLTTWELSAPPSSGPDCIGARRIFDHRRDYLDYEGPVSGNRGTVRQWDRGRCSVACAEALQWEVIFAGRRLRGRYLLRRALKGDRWEMLPL